MEGGRQLAASCSAGLGDTGSTGAAGWGRGWLGKEGFGSLGWQEGWVAAPRGEAGGDAQGAVPKSLASVPALSPPVQEEGWGQRLVLRRHLCEGSRGTGWPGVAQHSCVCRTGSRVCVKVSEGTAQGCSLCHTALP